MEKAQAIAIAEDMLQRVSTLVLATIGENGFPSARTMRKNAMNKSLETIYFTTQTGSRKTKELAKNNKVSVHYYESGEKGHTCVFLEGEAQVTRDKSVREKLWTERSLRVYPEGVDDPRYTVIIVKPQKLRLAMGKDSFEFSL
ncbi:MAG: pyridoxamine 5'-phosphate oxidase family protein [Peptococcaceae bacterium]|nr:pyridoxamine 5'-phosphate oxidase family protein [Peptococcaceae bacterium]